MKIARFEDIQAWQEARKLVTLVYQAIAASQTMKRDFRLVNQMQSAAVSTMSNIAEGFARKGDKEFSHFLFIAKGSAAELQSQLYVASDLGYLPPEKFTTIYNQAESVSKLCSGFLKYLNKIPAGSRCTEL